MKCCPGCAWAAQHKEVLWKNVLQEEKQLGQSVWTAAAVIMRRYAIVPPPNARYGGIGWEVKRRP